MGHSLGPADKRELAPLLRVAGIHQLLDPRSCILASLVFAALAVRLSSITALLMMLLLAAMFLIAARMPLATTLKRVAAMDGFILLMLVMLPFTVKGTPVFHLFGMPASVEGFERAIVIALKANAIMLCLLSLVGSMEPARLAQALHRLKTPNNLVHLMMFTIRYVDLLQREYARMRAAMKVRGFRAGNNWHTYRSMGYLFGMIMIRAMERAERVLDAMKARGFSGRMLLNDASRFRLADGVFAGLLAISFLFIVAVDHVDLAF